MTLRPSETLEGKSWLENFLPEEQHAAQLLINSLRIISATAFRAHTAELLSGIKNDLQRPMAFYPIRELPKYLPSAPNAERGANASDFEDGEGYGPLLPLDDPFEPLPGSEGIAGNVIREVIGHRPVSSIASSPKSLPGLRKAAARTIVLVDDYSGTGTRVVEYVDSWMRHPTIRSWYSYGRIRFHVALFTASGSAIERIKGHSRIDRVHYWEQAPDFGTVMWTDYERDQIQKICVKYAYSSIFELGYKRAAGLLILQHTVPNNLPAILWQQNIKRRQEWKPLFGDRRISPRLQVDLDDYKLEVDAAVIAKSIGQARLGVALSEQPNPATRMLFLVLAASAKRVQDPAKLSVMLQTSTAAAKQTQLACQQLGLLDQQGRLTDAGRNELRRARTRGDEISPNRLQGNAGPYYPTQLRGASEI